MRFAKAICTLSAILFFVAPTFTARASETPHDLKSICDVVMAHDSLTAQFVERPPFTVKSGETITSKINIKNKTVYTYKGTQILYKVFYKGDDGERLVDVGLFPELYDVIGGSSMPVDVLWKSDVSMQSGLYYMDIYVIQNGIHVIEDFGRAHTAKSTLFFNIDGNNIKNPIYLDSDKTLIGGFPYEKEKMLLFSREDNNDTSKFVIKNTSKEKQEVSISWKVYRYGLFEDKDILLTTSTTFAIDSSKDYDVNLNIPLIPSNRYHAILDIENNGLHTVEMYRWARGLPSTPSLDNYGIVKDGDFLSESEVSKDFGLIKGERYIAFACLVGGYENNKATVSMRLRDDNGDIIFSQEESRMVGTETAAFEYPFIPTKFSKNMKLDLTVMAIEDEQKVTWRSDCGENIEGTCKNNSILSKIKTIYLIPTFIIVFLFLIPYFLGLKK